MDSSPQPPAKVRYFLARFKPLRQPKYWLPPSLALITVVCAWQYWTHRDWLSTNLGSEQPQTSELEASGNLLEDPIESLSIDSPDNLSNPSQIPNRPSLSLDSLLAPPFPSEEQENRKSKSKKNPQNNPFSQLNPSPQLSDKSPNSTLFPPLIPNFKRSEVPSASELLKLSKPESFSGNKEGNSPVPVKISPIGREGRRQQSRNNGARIASPPSAFDNPRPVTGNQSSGNNLNNNPSLSNSFSGQPSTGNSQPYGFGGQVGLRQSPNPNTPSQPSFSPPSSFQTPSQPTPNYGYVNPNLSSPSSNQPPAFNSPQQNNTRSNNSSTFDSPEYNSFY